MAPNSELVGLKACRGAFSALKGTCSVLSLAFTCHCSLFSLLRLLIIPVGLSQTKLLQRAGAHSFFVEALGVYGFNQVSLKRARTLK